jgi:hypothetical protein
VTDRLLARFFATLHIAFALFVVFGGLLVLHWPRLFWFHIAAIVWAAATLSLDLGCPLTAWEKSFSRRAGIEPYPEGFVAHYLGRANLSPNGSKVFHIALGVGAISLNMIIYTFFRF